MNEAPKGIVLTDPAPLPRSSKCPRCGAGAHRREEACGFGCHRPVICGVCGYEFGEDA